MWRRTERTANINGKVPPAGHKVLINDAAEGTDILKYGYPIGHAKTGLKAGEWVNENNLKTNLAGTLEYTYPLPNGIRPPMYHLRPYPKS